jgi:2-hydroxychromene-2-carboxylate isomerase
MFHPTLKKVVLEYGERVHFVRLDLPLESHAHARGAAKAHLCADEQKAGDRMAEALFETEDLSSEGLVAVAKSVGLDLPSFERCVAAPQTETKLVAIESILKDSGMLQGLPTTFVGNEMIVGAMDDVALRDTFERAARGGGAGGIPGYAYVAVVVALAGFITWAGRSSRKVTA